MEVINRLLAVLAGLVAGLVLAEGAVRAYEGLVLNRPRGVHAELVDLAELNYNDSTVRRDKPVAQYRVLSLGDSFAYAITRYPYSYHGVAAETLGRLEPARTFRIVNLGEPAISFYQYIARYRHWSRLIDHDAVVFTVYLGNDFTEVAYNQVADEVELNRLYDPLEVNLQTGSLRARRIPHRHPLRLLDYLHVQALWLKGDIRSAIDTGQGPYNLALAELGEAAYSSTLLRQMDTFDHERLELLQEGLFAMVQLVRFVSGLGESGKSVLIMLAPSEAQVAPAAQDELAERFGLDLARYDLELPAFLVQETVRRIDPRIPVLHLHETLSCAERQGQDLYYGRDTHWSVQGNRIVGELLARAMAASWFAQDPGPDLDLGPCVAGEPALGMAPDPSRDRQLAFDRFVAPLLSAETWAATTALAARPPPPLSTLSPARGETRLAVDRVNAVSFAASAPGESISVAAGVAAVTVAGWAVDAPAGKPAGGVVVTVVGGREYPAAYGLARGDVATHFGNPEYRYAGFEVAIPVAELGRGEHALSIRVLTHDRRRYYSPDVRILVRVE